MDYSQLWKKYKEPFLYLLFGGLTTVINIIVFQACSVVAGASTVVSNTIAWILSVLFAFYTNRKFVFESKSDTPIKEMFQFYAARIFTFLVETLVLYVLIDYLGISNLISKIVSNIIVIVLNYILSKLWIFKKEK